MLDSYFFENSAFIDLTDIHLAVGLTTIKHGFTDNAPNIETVERCYSCKKGFLSRWGSILRCEDHKYLERTPIPEAFSVLKKKLKPL